MKVKSRLQTVAKRAMRTIGITIALQQKTRWQSETHWRTSIKRVLLQSIGAGVALLATTIVIGGYVYGWTWTGVVKQTFWDWLQLLIAPAVLAAVGYWFSWTQKNNELSIADQRTQDAALQAYLDQTAQLLIDRNLRNSGEEEEVRTLARARTITILKSLNASRKRDLLMFLYESKLIQHDAPVVSLEGADLRGANLIGCDLSNANLSDVNLQNADMRSSDLTNTNLTNSWMTRADLTLSVLPNAQLIGTTLLDANLSSAELTGADFTFAQLQFADFQLADLTGANLSHADLSDANLTEEQLATCKSLEDATMPNGQKYAEWLKDNEDRGDDEAIPSSK